MPETPPPEIPSPLLPVFHPPYRDNEVLQSAHLHDLARWSVTTQQWSASLSGLFGFFCPSWKSIEEVNCHEAEESGPWKNLFILTSAGTILHLPEKMEFDGIPVATLTELTGEALQRYPTMLWGACALLRGRVEKLRSAFIGPPQEAQRLGKGFPEIFRVLKRLLAVDHYAPVWAGLERLHSLERSLENCFSEVLADKPPLTARSSVREIAARLDAVHEKLQKLIASFVRFVKSDRDKEGVERLFFERDRSDRKVRIVGITQSCIVEPWLESRGVPTGATDLRTDGFSSYEIAPTNDGLQFAIKPKTFSFSITFATGLQDTAQIQLNFAHHGERPSYTL